MQVMDLALPQEMVSGVEAFRVRPDRSLLLHPGLFYLRVVLF